MVFYYSLWKDWPDTGRSTGSYIVFYQCGPIENCTHVTFSVAQSSAESEFNIACTSGMALANFRILNNELSKKDPYVVPEQSHFIILDIK